MKRKHAIRPRRHAAGVLAALWLATGIAAGIAGEAAPVPAPAAGGACYALLLGGLPGTEIHARNYRAWLTEFHACLTKTAGLPEGNVVVLSGDKAFGAPLVKEQATAEAVQKALAGFAGRVKPADQFVLFLVGHGVVSE